MVTDSAVPAAGIVVDVVMGEEAAAELELSVSSFVEQVEESAEVDSETFEACDCGEGMEHEHPVRRSTNIIDNNRVVRRT